MSLGPRSLAILGCRTLRLLILRRGLVTAAVDISIDIDLLTDVLYRLTKVLHLVHLAGIERLIALVGVFIIVV